jgi:putative acetyltransferase
MRRERTTGGDGTARADVEICEARSPEDVAIARTLFVEYAGAVDDPLCFSGFEEELASLPNPYAPPRGGLWLARVDDAVAGCVAVRPLDGERCEMKRLYVRAPFRGIGLGRTLAETCLAFARAHGYRRMFLDTLPSMARARALYASLGFVEAGPYGARRHPELHYLSLEL